jgi:hypothetical protein
MLIRVWRTPFPAWRIPVFFFTLRVMPSGTSPAHARSRSRKRTQYDSAASSRCSKTFSFSLEVVWHKKNLRRDFIFHQETIQRNRRPFIGTSYHYTTMSDHTQTTANAPTDPVLCKMGCGFFVSRKRRLTMMTERHKQKHPSETCVCRAVSLETRSSQSLDT